MIEEAKVSTADVRAWIVTSHGDFHVADIKKQLNIRDEDFNALRSLVSRLAKENICKSLGRKDGWYRKVDDLVKPEVFWKSTKGGKMDITFPKGTDDTSFDFQKHNVTVVKGDALVLAGLTNAGKSGFCLNLLAENVDKYKIKYITTEYNQHRFWNRIQNMTWVEWFKTDDPQNPEDCKFELIKRKENFEDVITEKDEFVIVDWINLVDEMWKIGKIVQDLKEKMNESGVLVVVLQKDKMKDTGRGGSWTLDFADLGIVMDFNRIKVVKCKSNGKLDGKLMYGFEIQEDGVKFKNIREIVWCTKCHGTTKIGGYKCDKCQGTGILDKEEWSHDVL